MNEDLKKLCAECDDLLNAPQVFKQNRGYRLLARCVSALREMDARTDKWGTDIVNLNAELEAQFIELKAERTRADKAEAELAELKAKAEIAVMS